MTNEHLYEVAVTWDSGRVGTVSSPVLDDAIAVATPPEFPKGVSGIWSPEHFFVAAVNSCLMTTFLAIAENSNLAFEQFTGNAHGKLELVDGKYMMSEVTLMPTLTISHEGDKARALRILEKSEASCLISRSVKSKINFQPVIMFENRIL